MRKIVGLILALFMLVIGSESVFAIQDVPVLNKDNEEKLFSDVPYDAWYAESLGKNVEMGLLSGYTDGTFHPEEAVKWWALSQVLYNFTEGYELEWWKDLNVGDLSNNAPWYSPVMNFAMDNGLVPNSSDNNYPEEFPTRFQVIQGFYQLGLRTEAVDTSYGRALDWALEMHILKGDEKGNLNLNKNITRAEYSEVLQRVWPIFEGKRTVSRLFFLEKQDIEYIIILDGQNGNLITYTDRESIEDIVEHLNDFQAVTMEDGRGGGFNAQITLVMKQPGVQTSAILGYNCVSNSRIRYLSNNEEPLSNEWIDQICER